MDELKRQLEQNQQIIKQMEVTWEVCRLARRGAANPPNHSPPHPSQEKLQQAQEAEQARNALLHAQSGMTGARVHGVAN